MGNANQNDHEILPHPCLSDYYQKGVFEHAKMQNTILKVLSESDIKMLPMGDKIYAFLLKRGIYKTQKNS